MSTRTNTRTKSRWAVSLAALLALAPALLGGCSGGESEVTVRESMDRGMIILGIDGMDLRLARRYMREGKMPNLKKLADRGQFKPLATTDPPQSPVAWSTFITGLDPNGHGIFDFVHRDPDGMTPYLSTSKAEQPDCTISLGSLQIPYCSAEVESLRRGVAFWELLEAERIPATVYKVPANFPPHEHWHSHTLSGMGTPDLMGTYGTFQVLTADPELAKKSFSGGLVHEITRDGKQRARAILHGPPNAYRKGDPPLELPVDLVVDREREVALMRTSGQEVLLERGGWSGWVPISFDLPLFFGQVPGMIKLYLKSVDPLTVYVSPINLDPADPVMPISSPPEFAAEVAEEAGRYYTQGMPEDTKALSADVLSDPEFLEQAEGILQERLRLLDRAMASYKGGLMFFYFSSLDQVCHVFWRTLDAPEDDPLHEHAHVIPDLYERMDAIVGRVLEQAPEGTEVVILSDHGFAPFTYKVHLNTWLYQKGYLALREDGSRGPGPLGHIDWSRTQAYALGLNQLFINLKGREPEGVVDPVRRDVLISRISRDLERMRDSSTGRPVVRRVFALDEQAQAAHPQRAPDMIVGYDRGYRSSDSSAMGKITDQVIEPNEEKWSGDHCMDPATVPGVLFSTVPLRDEPAGLVDMAPTILDYFDVPIPDGLAGQSVLGDPEEGEPTKN